MALAFDIETVPQEAALAVEYPADERRPPSNYGEEAAAKWREKDEAKWREGLVKDCSLDPFQGRVLCVGLAWSDSETESRVAITEEAEASMVESVLQRLCNPKHAPIISYFGRQFDLPFLLTRATILGVPVTSQQQGFMRECLKRYWTFPHVDVGDVLSQWDARRYVKLDTVARALGIGGKLHHGSEVFTMHKEGRHSEILTYAVDDAKKVLAVYRKLGWFLPL